MTVSFAQFKFAENPETRKRAREAHASRLAVNVPVFEKMLDLRRKVASLLGYESWADYVTEIRMAKNAKNVVEVIYYYPSVLNHLKLWG